MKIIKDKKNKKLWLSQENYVNKVLKRYNMDKIKRVLTPPASHFKIIKDMCLNSHASKVEMTTVLYASAVGSLMYDNIYTKPDIAQVERVVS